MQTIQLYSDADYIVNVVLDGQVFYLRFTWNTEASFWTMQIQDYNRVPLLNVKVLPNKRLLQRYSVEGMPQGEFVVVSKSSSVGRSDFADDYARLVYVSEAEL